MRKKQLKSSMKISRTEFEKAKRIVQFFDKSTIDLVETGKKLVSILGEIMESLADAKVKVTKYEKNIEPLTHRYIILSFSFLNLINGTPIDLFGVKRLWYDYSGTRVLLRSIIENYLTFDHLVVQTKDKEEMDFRLKIYEVQGYLNRRKIIPLISKEVEQLEDEKQIILQLINEIRDSKYFTSLFKGKQTKIEKIETSLKSESIFSWSEMFNNSLIKNSSTEMFWFNLSNHTHSEFIGINQVQYMTQNNNPTEIEIDQRLLLRINLGLSCLFIQNLISKYKSAEIVFNSKHLKYKEETDFWAEIAKNA